VLFAFNAYKRAHPEHAVALQEQLDSALRYICGFDCPSYLEPEVRVKWIGMLMQFGADPRSRPSDEEDDPSASALGLACFWTNVAAVKKLGLDPARDNLSELLSCANSEVIRYLLDLGASPNDKENGGSKALDGCLAHSLDSVAELVSRGAKWKPDGPDDIKQLRRELLRCDPDVTIKLLYLFRDHSACPQEQLKELINHPRMEAHLATHAGHLGVLGLKAPQRGV
jgi:hypothetical protein